MATTKVGENGDKTEDNEKTENDSAIGGSRACETGRHDVSEVIRFSAFRTFPDGFVLLAELDGKIVVAIATSRVIRTPHASFEIARQSKDDIEGYKPNRDWKIRTHAAILSSRVQRRSLSEGRKTDQDIGGPAPSFIGEMLLPIFSTS